MCSSDLPEARRARLVWGLRNLDGKAITPPVSREIELTSGAVVHHADVVFDLQLGWDKENTVLAAHIEDADSGEILSRQTALFTIPRFVEFTDPGISTAWVFQASGKAELTLESQSLALAVCLSFGPFDVELDDNFFDLHAGEPRRVNITFPPEIPEQAVKEAMHIMSLWHSYQSASTI